jgi:hypothetical protein
VYNNIKGSLCIKDIMTSGKYFNRAVMALDAPHIGHVVVETDDKIVVFGGGKDRYDISISEIQTTGRNVLIGLNLKYKVYHVKHPFQPIDESHGPHLILK